jgi:hypothetical protein
LSPAHGCGGARATIEFNNSPSAKKSGEARKQAGKKEGGLGEGIFARLPKRSPAALLVQSRGQQKSFLFLLEEKIAREKIKKCEENFFAGQRAKQAAVGRSVQNSKSGFSSKKVRILSKRYRQPLLKLWAAGRKILRRLNFKIIICRNHLMSWRM